MEKQIKLISTDTYQEVFSILAQEVKGKTNGITEKNLIFCEGKSSLMAERCIMNICDGTFNTDVFTFGNYLAKHGRANVLSKEGASMAIRKVLFNVGLKCFKINGTNFAPTLYDLIIQLKSVKISVDDLKNVSNNLVGVLRDKVVDIATIYEGYENFLKESNLVDQSTQLSFLPEILESDEEILHTNVYLVGWSSFTKQIRDIIACLIKRAKSVTAILTEGNNTALYVNETANYFRKICEQENIELIEEIKNSDITKESKTIRECLFKPNNLNKIDTDKIYYFNAKNPRDEIVKIAHIIKQRVLSGNRYSDFCLASFDTSYNNDIKKIFSDLEIPLFLDEDINPINHPLIQFVKNYIEAFRTDFDKKYVISLIKNPIFSQDKKLNDEFEDYITKFNINHKRFFVEFSFGDCQKFEGLRQKLQSVLSKFDIRKAFEILEASAQTDTITQYLDSINQSVMADISGQVYDAVIKILDEQDKILSGEELSYSEIRDIFNSGVLALKLSVIPQYQDAVFVGDYKETALCVSKYLFCFGLTSSVPGAKEDTSLLNDTDIDNLKLFNTNVEPKIQIVNARIRENLGVALSSFSEGLILSYPFYQRNGDPNVKSQALLDIENIFDIRELNIKQEFLTEKQGLNNFAYICGRFSERKRNDCEIVSDFYYADQQKADRVLSYSQNSFSERLNGSKPLIEGLTSPTAIEKFYQCPYMFFCESILRGKEKQDCEVDSLTVGNLIHKILEVVIKKCFIENKMEDIDVVDKVFEDVVKSQMFKEEYKRFLENPSTAYALKKTLSEAKKHCEKMATNIMSSEFKPIKTEAVIGLGENADYPPVPILDGKILIKGKIDRVDSNGKSFIIRDYKTGDVSGAESLLYSGQKLQLFLYSASVKDFEPAGIYYEKLFDKYVSVENKDKRVFGREIGQKANNSTFVEEDLSDYILYALKVAEKGAKYLCDGVIIPSPVKGSCDYCPYKGICSSYNDVNQRTIGRIYKSNIKEAVKGNGQS